MPRLARGRFPSAGPPLTSRAVDPDPHDGDDSCAPDTQ